MKNRNLYITLGPSDPLNPDFGYFLKIENSDTDNILLHTTRDPAKGIDLLSVEDCLRVIILNGYCSNL